VYPEFSQAHSWSTVLPRRGADMPTAMFTGRVNTCAVDPEVTHKLHLVCAQDVIRQANPGTKLYKNSACLVLQVVVGWWMSDYLNFFKSMFAVIHDGVMSIDAGYTHPHQC
jgi:hypothetical protein